MKSKIAYLRGLMDGMKLPDDDNGKLLRAIADCLDAIADEVEVESARTDVIEEQIDTIGEEVDDINDLLDEIIIEEDDEDEDDEEFDEELMPPMPGHCHGHHGPHGHCHGHHGPHGGHCCHHHEFDDEDEEFDGEAFLDSLNFFTCPNCGEIVPIDEDMLKDECDPICPRCNSHIFGADKEEHEENKE